MPASNTQLELERLVIRLTGDGQSYLEMLKNAEQQSIQFARELEAVFQRLSMVVAAAFDAIAGASVKAFSDFNKAMTESTAIIDGLTEAQRQQMEQQAKSLSMQNIQSPTELAKGFYYLASSGMSAQQSIAALPGVMRFATAGAFELEYATMLLSTAQSALKMRTEDPVRNLQNLTRISDVLVRAEIASIGTTRQFAKALTTDAGAAATFFGRSLEEAVGVLATYAQQGKVGAEAGNTYGRALRMLAGAAARFPDVHEKLGFKVFETEGDNKGKMRNMADIIENLETILKRFSPAARAAIMEMLGFKTLSQKFLAPLIGASEQIRRFQKIMEGAGGTTERVAERQLTAFANQMKILKNHITIAAIELGEMLAPAFMLAGDAIKDALLAIRSLDDQTKQMIVGVGAVVLVTLNLAAVLSTVYVLLPFLAAMSFPFTLMAGFILVASVAVTKLIEELGGLREVMVAIKASGEQAWAWLLPVRQAVGTFFLGIWRLAQETWTAIVTITQDLWRSIEENFHIGGETIRHFFQNVVIGISIALTTVVHVIESLVIPGMLGFIRLLYDGAQAAVVFTAEIMYKYRGLILIALTAVRVYLAVRMLIAGYYLLVGVLSALYIRQILVTTALILWYATIITARVAIVTFTITLAALKAIVIITYAVLGLLTSRFVIMTGIVLMVKGVLLLLSVQAIILKGIFYLSVASVMAVMMALSGLQIVATVCAFVFSSLLTVIGALSLLLQYFVTLIVTGKIAIIVYNIAIVLATVAMFGFNAILASTNVQMAMLNIAAAAFTAFALGVVFAVIASAAIAVYQTFEGISDLLIQMPRSFGAIKEFTELFQEWYQIIIDIKDAMGTDMELAWKLIRAAGALAVAQFKDFWPPTWEFIKEGFDSLWEYVNVKFQTSFLLSILWIRQQFFEWLNGIVVAVDTMADEVKARIEKAKAEEMEANLKAQKRLNDAAGKFKTVESDATKNARRELELLRKELQKAKEAAERAKLPSLDEMLGFERPKDPLGGLEDMPGSLEDLGEDMGESLARGMNTGVKKFEAVLARSAEAITRLSEYRDALEGGSNILNQRRRLNFRLPNAAGGGAAPDLGPPKEFGPPGRGDAKKISLRDPGFAGEENLKGNRDVLIQMRDLLVNLVDKPPVEFDQVDLA